jgi:CHAD domain-containing protein
MKRKLFLQNYKRQRRRFYISYSKVLESQGMEDLHRLRLIIKELKSAWALMEIISGGEWSKKSHFEWISKLFDRAGKVREAQVNLQLAKRYRNKYLTSFLKHLRKIKKRTSKRLLKTFQTFDVEDLELLDLSIPKSIRDLSNENVLRESVAYILRLDREISKVKKLPPDTHKIHLMRIKLRRMLEILHIANSLSGKLGLQDLHKRIKALNQRIGDWHDYTILTRSLKHFGLRTRDKKNIRYLKILSKDIKSKQQKREKKIYQAINKYLSGKQRKQMVKMLT